MVEARAATDTEDERLVAFTYGTFHTVTLIVSAVIILHLAGALVGLLGGLNTLTGLALFAALWATTSWSTRKALRGAPGPVLAARTPIGDLVIRAIRSGALNGILFLAAAAVIVGFSSLVTGEGPAIVIFVAGGLIFVPLAAIIGALFGVIYVAIDLLHLWALRRLLAGNV